MHPGNRVLWGCSALPSILPRPPQLCQNGGLSVLSATGETEKWSGWETTVMSLVKKKFPGENGSVRHCVVMMQHFHAVAARRSRWVWTLHVPLTLSSLNASLIICQDLQSTFSKICTKFYAVSLSTIAKSHQATYRTPNKYKDVRHQFSCTHCLPRYANTVASHN
jgi:hypothetical protein